MRSRSLFVWTLLLAACASSGRVAPRSPSYGVVVMAHGGTEEWNRAILETVRPLRRQYPLEVAFGMADPSTIQEAVSKLEDSGVQRVGVVRLFISGDSWLERTRMILGLEPGAPPAPQETAAGTRQGSGASGHGVAEGSRRSDHHAHHGVGDGGSSGHSMELWRIETRSSFALTREGLADAPGMARVLRDRAGALSRDPSSEDLLILAHGPGDDEENRRWVESIAALAAPMRGELPFRRIEVMTLREDWPDKREEAEKRIRTFVAGAGLSGGRALVIPFRVFGFGPYEEVLTGLDYVSDGQGLIPHAAVEEWLGSQAGALAAGTFERPLQARGSREE